MSTDRPDLPTFDGRNAIEHADSAAEAIRAINHITGWAHGGMTYPADAYNVLSHLASAAAMLPQALHQINDQIGEWHAAGHVGIDRGTEFGGRPDVAVATASSALWHASNNAVQLYTEMNAAAQALGNAHWIGPDPADDGPSDSGEVNG